MTQEPPQETRRSARRSEAAAGPGSAAESAAATEVNWRALASAGIGIVAALAVVATALALVFRPAEEPQAAPTPSASPSETPMPSPTPSPTPEPEPEFDKAALSIDAADSIWVVADKLRPLNPLDYAPADLVTAAVPFAANGLLRAEAATAMEQMVAAAAAEGAGQLMIQNGYRSYSTQVNVHARHVNQLGQERARAQSAVPGYSEHQTGLSADLMPASGECAVQACFAQTPQGIWLAANAWRFGYHLRYPDGKTDVTGYIFEPWHYRYVGLALSTELHETGTLTLEEFFGLPAAPDYAPGV